ncbi:MAG: DUF1934 domain-containing protein [Lachnospiraceae bacterium]|jgi:uncharacterized beta-barrel protein YwiB (DUF1934 family)|nr:DUF1934 domain-containing protein [Lachnospiraceae bacterium]
MKKDVLVSVRGTQFLEDDRDTIEVITAGSYYERNGKHYLLYDETIDGTAVPVHNRVKAAPGIVEVIKSGAVDCRMVFECGKKNMVSYVTPFGLIILGITTSVLNVQTEGDMLCLHMEYALEMNGEFVSGCIMEIRACPRTSGAFQLTREE